MSQQNVFLKTVKEPNQYLELDEQVVLLPQKSRGDYQLMPLSMPTHRGCLEADLERIYRGHPGLHGGFEDGSLKLLQGTMALYGNLITPLRKREV